MNGKVFVLLVVLCFMPAVLTKTKRYTKSTAKQTNTLYKIRCDLLCIERTKEAKSLVSVSIKVLLTTAF